MKSIFKKLVIMLLVGGVSLPTVKKVADISEEATKTEYAYLIAGLDDAAQNTDVLALVSYNTDGNLASVIQIPRDTYINYNNRQGRINHLYASYRNEGLSQEKSMEKTVEFLEGSFGITLDGYAAVTTEVFRDAIDSIGGVVITMPGDFVYNDPKGKYSFTLSKGENLIDGRTAEIFVRHRKGYSLGDLGRLDAQKIFLNGLYNTAVKKIGLFDFIKCIGSIKGGIITDFSISDLLIMVLKHSSKFRDVELSYITFPGEAVCTSTGKWYYILNKNASQKLLLAKIRSFTGNFDINGYFLDLGNPDFTRIYNSNDIGYKEYSAKELLNIYIAKD